MVNWKVALFVVIIAVLVMAVGMWFGYRYVSEQDDISPEGWRERSNRAGSRFDEPLAYLPARAGVSQEQFYCCKHYSRNIIQVGIF
ncbi:hypothetical protein C6500_04390 [Candidatus Poribacteria bacterium]|nr:MAG: hypothetical protein C6500_04390 [Candidatus Poribacteria bacterium]